MRNKEITKKQINHINTAIEAVEQQAISAFWLGIGFPMIGLIIADLFILFG